MATRKRLPESGEIWSASRSAFPGVSDGQPLLATDDGPRRQLVLVRLSDGRRVLTLDFSALAYFVDNGALVFVADSALAYVGRVLDRRVAAARSLSEAAEAFVRAEKAVDLASGSRPAYASIDGVPFVTRDGRRGTVSFPDETEHAGKEPCRDFASDYAIAPAPVGPQAGQVAEPAQILPGQVWIDHEDKPCVLCLMPNGCWQTPRINGDGFWSAGCATSREAIQDLTFAAASVAEYYQAEAARAELADEERRGAEATSDGTDVK